MRGLILALVLLVAHPLHSTHTDIVEENGEVRLHIRAFTDDLDLAVRQRLGAVDDSALVRYLRATVTLLDPAGHTVLLSWLGKETQGDVTLLHLRAAGLTRLSGSRVGQTMAMELFTDQVNVVQVRYGTRQQSLLFIPGDGLKRLP